ncbi:MAG: PKD domain-containing protein, partial [Bacteroidetes bacterium]|nr:PKD domain-containing protein [Bacteroidota bacterium]
TASLILTSTNNGSCGAVNDTVIINIDRVPTANAGPDQLICIGTQQIPINGTILNASGVIWTTSGTGYFMPSDTLLNVVYYPSTLDSIIGNIQLVLSTTGNFICATNSDTMNINFINPITPAFSYSIPCLNVPVQFTDNSIINSGTISSWQWTFDGSATDFNQNPSYTFNTTGIHNVQLIISSSLGCSYTIQKQLFINPLPSVNFEASLSCFLDNINFIDESTISSGVINNWLWNFGDTTVTSNLQNPTHLYQTAGTYQVTLTATSDSGCTASLTTPIDVYPQPNAGFIYVDNCNNFTVTFTDTSSSISQLPINSWLWNFGDGNNAIIQSPVHSYSQSGQYQVQLIVGVSNNCKDTVDLTINTTNLHANFGYTLTCNSNLVNFADSSAASGTAITNLIWEFGDGNTSTSQNPSYLYADTGSYQVNLIVETAFCSDTISKDITMQHLSGNFNYIYNCQNFNTTFTDISTYAGSTPNSWNWLFGDGNSSILQNPVYTYSDTGNYQVQLIISTPNNCVDTVSSTVSIYNVVADFAVTNACIYDSIIFNDLTHYTHGNIISWNWDFDDGTTSIVQNPFHLYNIAKTYNVQFNIQTAEGCSDTLIKQVAVYNAPVAQFDITTLNLQINNPISFTDASTGSSSWIWYFGDNFGTSTNQNPTYTYLYPGNYIISEVVRNEYSCRDTAIQTITIINQDEVYPPVLPSAFTPNGDNNNDTLYVRGGPFKELLFRVFNVWGTMIYETTDPTMGWDGKYKGDMQSNGVFVCTVKATTITDKEYSFSQEITLIR